MNAEANGELIPVGGGDPIPLVRSKLTIGRRDSCDICLRFPNISSRHCELTFQDGYWLIRDLGSTNGIKVNGSRTQQRPLQPGDEVTIAKHRYKIAYQMTADPKVLEALTEDHVLGQSLLEKAGLERPRERNPKPQPGRPGGGARPAEDEDEEDE